MCSVEMFLLKQLGFKKFRNGNKIKCFEKIAKKYVTSPKSKGTFSNDKKNQDCLMTIILHTPSPETVSTLSYSFQTNVSLANISLDMQPMEDALLIKLKTLSRNCGKAFTKLYKLKKRIVLHLGQFYRSRKESVKIILC